MTDSTAPTARIYSWNVNGIRSVERKGFVEWLDACDGQIVALQEVRAREEQVPPSIREKDAWHLSWNAAERPGYSGVALLSRAQPDAVDTSLGEDRFDVEGRIQVASYGGLLLANGYFPNGNGKNRDLSRIPYKLDFYRRLFEVLEPARAGGRPVLVMGDFNTAHEEIDLARPKQNRETSGFRPEEREELDRWLRSGWIDTFRHFEKGEGHYTWWSQRKGVRERNVGWRLDYVLASPGAMTYVRSAAIHPEVSGSDHCPISIDLHREIFRRP
ncbi:MAG: exodeoxyribonuclease III [Holophagales bacterium]|nr:exodeoxyribonuclease III [Holophagales bacterium]